MSTGLLVGHMTLKKQLDVAKTNLYCAKAFTEMLSVHRERALYPSITLTVHHAAYILIP